MNYGSFTPGPIRLRSFRTDPRLDGAGRQTSARGDRADPACDSSPSASGGLGKPTHRGRSSVREPANKYVTRRSRAPDTEVGGGAQKLKEGLSGAAVDVVGAPTPNTTAGAASGGRSRSETVLLRGRSGRTTSRPTCVQHGVRELDA